MRATSGASIGLRSETAFGLTAALLLACVQVPAPEPLDPLRYRLTGSGEGWNENGDDPVYEDLAPRYPEFFAVVLDPRAIDDEPPRRDLVADLERDPPDRTSYDALNAVAIAYFEMNWRGEQARAAGDMDFLRAGFACAKLAAIPWRAYREIEDPRLRDAILDFFEDVAQGGKRGTERTRGRLERVVDDLRRDERDASRRARIESLVLQLRAPPSARDQAPLPQERLGPAREQAEPDEEQHEARDPADPR